MTFLFEALVCVSLRKPQGGARELVGLGDSGEIRELAGES